MRTTWRKAVVTGALRRTRGIRSIFLSLGEPFAFVPGQHLDIRLVAPDGYEARRSYSIASAPEQPDILELAVDRLDDGEVSPFIHDELRIGDEIEVRGPIGGHFIWTVADPAPVLLTGGGSGIVPLMSMIRHHALRQSGKRIVLAASARTAADLPYLDELETFGRKDKGFIFLPTLTREAEAAPRSRSGRIDRKMLSEALDACGTSPEVCFVCGHNAFVDAIATLLVDLAVPSQRIRTERYGA